MAANTLIRPAAGAADFGAAHALLAEMGRWDAAAAEAHGIPGQDILSAYYADSVEDLSRRYAGPDAALLLAWVEGRAVGTVAFAPAGDEIAEIDKFFVSPDQRGRGLAGQLLGAAFDAMERGPFRRVRLESAEFMATALRVYEGQGFIRCAPFRAPLPSAAHVAVFMERPLGRSHDDPRLEGRGTTAG